MPRRRALTEAQLEGLLALPATEADLSATGRSATPTSPRSAGAGATTTSSASPCSSARFRYPGRLLRPGEAVPEPALRFVAEQVGVGAGGACRLWHARPQTRSRASRRAARGLRLPDVHARPPARTAAWLLPVALATTSADGGRRGADGGDPPAPADRARPSVVEDLTAAALTAAERHVARQLTRGLSRRRRTRSMPCWRRRTRP